jgi:hypothetical protein
VHIDALSSFFGLSEAKAWHAFLHTDGVQKSVPKKKSVSNALLYGFSIRNSYLSANSNSMHFKIQC